jgi:chromosome segregation ATPase
MFKKTLFALSVLLCSTTYAGNYQMLSDAVVKIISDLEELELRFDVVNKKVMINQENLNSVSGSKVSLGLYKEALNTNKQEIDVLKDKLSDNSENSTKKLDLLKNGLNEVYGRVDSIKETLEIFQNNYENFKSEVLSEAQSTSGGIDLPEETIKELEVNSGKISKIDQNLRAFSNALEKNKKDVKKMLLRWYDSNKDEISLIKEFMKSEMKKRVAQAKEIEELKKVISQMKRNMNNRPTEESVNSNKLNVISGYLQKN